MNNEDESVELEVDEEALEQINELPNISDSLVNVKKLTQGFDPIFEMLDNVRKVTKPLMETLQNLEIPSELWHYETVKESYDREEYSVVVILLSTYFESVITELLEHRFNQIMDEKSTHGSSTALEDKSFKLKLQVSRILGILDEDRYGTINKVRNYRNDYAHDIEAFSPENDLGIENSEVVDDAYELYEEMMLGTEGKESG